jgi:hypothetical protein
VQAIRIHAIWSGFDAQHKLVLNIGGKDPGLRGYAKSRISGLKAMEFKPQTAIHENVYVNVGNENAAR